MQHSSTLRGASARLHKPACRHWHNSVVLCKSGGRNQPQRPARPSRPSNDAIAETRQKTNYRNRWNRREVDLSKQVEFSKPLPDTPTVAIIGGGLSGLSCAAELARLGIKSVVFDTGEHGVGGRLATRRTSDQSIHRAWLGEEYRLAGLSWDHAAQFFTVGEQRFGGLVQQWEDAGAVRRWQGPVGQLRSGEFAADTSQERYVATGGMRQLAAHLLSHAQAAHPGMIELQRPLWVSKMHGDAATCKWKLIGENANQGSFDAVVIAHNGKCANRLVGPTGAPLVAQQLMKLRLSAVWAVMLALPQGLPSMSAFEGAFVQDDPVLSWAANNTAKLQLRHPKLPGLECWTLISTNSYGKGNKVPQEAVPAAVQDKVAADMMAAFERALGVAPGSLPDPLFYRSQLWGAALPLNTPGVECIYDPLSRVGVCGDWLMGSSMQAAVVSGLALAQRIAAARDTPVQQQASLAMGLQEEFRPVQGAAIGQFPAAASAKVPVAA